MKRSKRAERCADRRAHIAATELICDAFEMMKKKKGNFKKKKKKKKQALKKVRYEERE